MCPTCLAPFVAPPAAKGAQPDLKRKLLPILIGSLIGLCAAVGVGLLFFTPTAPLTAKPPVSVAAQAVDPGGLIGIGGVDTPKAIASAASAETEQGVFKVIPQSARPPIVAIRNDSREEFRLQLQDKVGGGTRTELIPAESRREFQVPAGNYNAVIDSPTNSRVVAANGQLQVQEFHQYQASFYIGSAAQHRDFYIGD